MKNRLQSWLFLPSSPARQALRRAENDYRVGPRPACAFTKGLKSHQCRVRDSLRQERIAARHLARRRHIYWPIAETMRRKVRINGSCRLPQTHQATGKIYVRGGSNAIVSTTSPKQLASKSTAFANR